jgi:hypothetical protein
MQNRMSVFGFALILLAASAAEGQQLFNNFPVNGQISAFQVNAGYSVSESFTLSAGATAGEVSFGAWLTPGDSVTGVSWAIGTSAFDTSVASGVAGATSSFNNANADAYDVDTVSFALPGITLPAGTYYLTLSAAISAGANPVYWDINDAAGLDAWGSSAGHVSASNTCFQVIGISGTCASSFEILSTSASVSPSPSSVTFPNQTVNTTSAAQVVTITNNGSGAATISGIAITGTNAVDFAQTNNCPASLAASAFCTVSVTFTPQSATTFSAAVTITGSSPLSVPLSGTGTAAPPTITLAPGSITFPNQTVNTTSAAQNVTLTNNGPGALTIASIAIGGTNPLDFGQTNNCPVSPATLAANAFCTIGVTFTPQAANPYSATVTVNDNGVGSPQSVNLSGTGIPAGPAVTLAPASLTFPAQTLRTTGAAQSFTVTNNGAGALTIASIGLGGSNPGDFAQTNNCPISPATLAASSFCTVNVTFTPLAVNLRSAAVLITDNGSGSPQSEAVSGTGIVPSWPNGYGYQATFTVAANQVPSAQTNFPALISGTFADFATTANGGRIFNTCTQTAGNNSTAVPCDLIFTSDAAGTMPLSWEFETYNASTGAANIWVNVPSIGNGTVVYAWYGQPSVTTLQTTPTAAWSNSFEAVYHLKENPAGAAPQMNDSTGNANHATMGGAVQASQQQAGQIDGSINFEGNTWAGPANPANFSFERTDSFSISGWFKLASNSSGTLLSKLGANTSLGWAFLQFTSGSGPAVALGLFGGSGNQALAETPALTTGVWHNIVVTYSGTSTVAGMQIYVDGVSQTLTNLTNNLTSSIVNAIIPAINGRGGAASMSTDSMDELRVSAKGVVFTPAWVTASYNNQKNPGAFFTVATGLTTP